MKKAPCTPKNFEQPETPFRAKGRGRNTSFLSISKSHVLLSCGATRDSPRTPTQLYAGLSLRKGNSPLLPIPKKQTALFGYHPSSVGVPTDKSCRKKRRKGVVTLPLFTKRTVPLMGCWGILKGEGACSNRKLVFRLRFSP